MFSLFIFHRCRFSFCSVHSVPYGSKHIKKFLESEGTCHMCLDIMGEVEYSIEMARQKMVELNRKRPKNVTCMAEEEEDEILQSYMLMGENNDQTELQVLPEDCIESIINTQN